MPKQTVQSLIETASLLRGQNPKVFVQGLAGDTSLAQVKLVVQEIHRHLNRFYTGVLYWGFTEGVGECYLNEVNPNLFNFGSVNYKIYCHSRPFNKSHREIPMNYYRDGFIQIPFNSPISSGNFCFSFETTLEAEEVGVDTYTPASLGSPIVSVTDTDFTVYAYSDTNAYPITMTTGNWKQCGYIEVTPNMDTPLLGVLISVKDPKVMGGFKFESGRIATPANTDAVGVAKSLDQYTTQRIYGDTTYLEIHDGNILRGTFPSELAITHNASPFYDFTLSTELDIPNMDVYNATLWGIATMQDQVDFDGVESYTTRYRKEQYEKYLRKIVSTGLNLSPLLSYGSRR